MSETARERPDRGRREDSSEAVEERERLREDLAALRLPRGPGTEAAAAAELEGAARRGPRWPRRVLLVALLLGLALAAWRLLAPAPLRVEVATAVPYSEAARVPVPVLSGSGYLVPAQPFVAIGSRIAGRIQRYRVDEGDRVRAGDPLVELDPAPYRAVVDQLEASLESARARALLAERELERARQLSDQGVSSRDELERRESEARVARAQVLEFEASLERARIDLADSVIRAPTDGVVLETFKQPGEVAVPGGFSGSGDLLRLANLAELRAELDVNEADLGQVFLGQPAEVTPDAFPAAVYAAEVVELAPQIDRQKGTRKVEVRVLEPDARLLPDMSVRVVFLSRLGESAGPAGAVIPRNALQRDPGGRTFSWTVDAGRAYRTPIEVGEILGESVVVRDGLAGGKRVIAGAGPDRDGARVEVIEPAAAASGPP